eukprot:8039654-Heterocapsa_arctica.AAC.1
MCVQGGLAAKFANSRLAVLTPSGLAAQVAKLVSQLACGHLAIMAIFGMFIQIGLAAEIANSCLTVPTSSDLAAQVAKLVSELASGHL